MGGAMSHFTVSPEPTAAARETSAATPSRTTGLAALVGPLETQRNASDALRALASPVSLAGQLPQTAAAAEPPAQAEARADQAASAATATPTADGIASGQSNEAPNEAIKVPASATEAASSDAAGPTEPAPRKKSGGRPLSAVWQYYTKISDASATSKRYEVSCLACSARFLSRVEQMEAHLANGCTRVAPEVQQVMRGRVTHRANVRAGKEDKESKARASGQKRTRELEIIVPSPGLKRTTPSKQGLTALRLRYPQVYVPSHPLVGHWLAVCRNKASPPPIFRSAVAELGRWLIYEAAQDWLPIVESQVETPMGVAECKFVDPTKPVKIVPILRAGLVLLEQASTVLPSSETYHVGYVRNETTLEASMYLNKLPSRLSADDRVLVCDPMLATGGTMLNVLNDLVGRGASQEYIRIISVVVAPKALNLLSRQYPGLRVYCGMIDEETNDQGMIVPGLGDAGDRAFGTA